MNAVDRALRHWRVRRAVPWIPPASRVLDVGCFDALLFDRLGSRLRDGVGLDPLLDDVVVGPRYQLRRGAFPHTNGIAGDFDVITMLAVFEHVPSDEVDAWVSQSRRLLRPGGLAILTMPSPAVDRILDVALRLRLLHGMEFGQHHGSLPADAAAAFERSGFTLVRWERFQLRLNNLLVFRAP